MRHSPEKKRGEISVEIHRLLADGPKTAEELPSPRWTVASRVHALNRFWRRMGSHWRIRGERVWMYDEAWKRRRATVLYRLTMEL